jgi:hypothetical protein
MFAQSPSRPAAGERVRVHLTVGTTPVDGSVIGWNADTLVLAAVFGPSRYTQIPRTNIASYQPSLGYDRERGFARGAKTGALIGGGVGIMLLIVGAVADAQGECDDVCVPATVVGGVLGVGATLGGMMLGAAIGAIAAPERWGEAQSVASSDYRSPSTRLALMLSIAR